MKKISHILSAIDFSYSASTALERAGLIAREHEASLLIFHMLSATLQNSWPRGFDPLLANIGDSVHQEIRIRLEELVEQQRHFGTKKTASLLAESKGLDALLDAIKQHKTDLVVAGSHGTGYWHELFLGSFITKLIAHSPVPTLIVKGTTPSAYKKILIPVDFSTSTASVIEAAKAIAPNAQKILLHVAQTPHEGMMRLKRATPEKSNNIERRASIRLTVNSTDSWHRLKMPPLQALSSNTAIHPERSRLFNGKTTVISL